MKLQRIHKEQVEWGICGLLGMVFSGALFAQASTSDQLYYVCKNDKNVRTIRVFRGGAADEWKITYTKGGADTFVGGGKSFEFCKSRAENIRENLEKSNWECKDRSEARVSVEASTAGQESQTRP